MMAARPTRDPTMPTALPMFTDVPSVRLQRSNATGMSCCDDQRSILARIYPPTTQRWFALPALRSCPKVEKAVLDPFLVERRRDLASHNSRRALSPMLGYLRRIDSVTKSTQMVPPSRLRCFLHGLLGTSRPNGSPRRRPWRPALRSAVRRAGVSDRHRQARDVSAVELTRFLADRLPPMSGKGRR